MTEQSQRKERLDGRDPPADARGGPPEPAESSERPVDSTPDGKRDDGDPVALRW